MKYMGSKRMMLTNGLGRAIDSQISGRRRFVDLFLGTGEVASFVARRHPVAVYGVDLQAYSVVLTEAVIARASPLSGDAVWRRWHSLAKDLAMRYNVPALADARRFTRRFVQDVRDWCVGQDLPITRAYGGHYFSPEQAIRIDAFRSTLPESEPERTVGLAALIRAASQCVASPGHTAQPFQPTVTARRFLHAAWRRDLPTRVDRWVKAICGQYARTVGAARIADANELADSLSAEDLVFLDPPYSGVQYSRFYHVLESIARGVTGEVSGQGRYPDAAKRPKSRYSMVTESEDALNQLLFLISTTGAKAILTFPDHPCSNGLSGETVREIAKAHFRVDENRVKSKFSTLGGRGTGTDKVAMRQARHEANELMLVLRPK